MITAFIILAVQITYVSFFTIRMIFTLKGQKYLAASLSTLEVLIYVLGLSLVLENLNQIQNVAAYCIGYGLGVITGTFLEEKMALGYITVMVISQHLQEPLPHLIREQGYGVTSWRAEGMDGERLVMEILTPRKKQRELYRLITDLEPKAFFITQEPKYFHGGFWTRSLQRPHV